MKSMTDEPDARPTQPIGNSLKYWGLWFAVLPCALLAVILVSFPIHLVAVSTFGGGGTDPVVSTDDEGLRTIERLAQAYFAPVAMIVAGSWVAPSHKVHTAMVLTILYCFAAGAILMYAATNEEYDTSSYGWFELALTVGLMLAGAITGLYYVYRKEQPDATAGS